MKNKKRTQAKKGRNSGKETSGNPIPKSIIAIFGILIVLLFAYFILPQGSDEWTVSSDGIMSYPENKGKVDVTVLDTESGNGYVLETISFQSKDYVVEGLLRVPQSDKKVPLL